jgi:hypothetical protein
MKRAIAVLSAVLVAGCGKSPTSPTPQPPASPAATYPATTLSFTSDPQDFVGRGRSETFTLQNSLFQANVAGNGEYLSIVIRRNPGPTPVWTLIVDAPNGSKIAPGTCQTFRDYGSDRWTADFGGDGRSCGSITGRMVIHSFDFIPENQALKNFRASFEQHCQGASPALRGEVAILADPWR